jgi:hypothetical protein
MQSMEIENEMSQVQKGEKNDTTRVDLKTSRKSIDG